ncbi:aminoglycoside phosphotransferase family protein [Deinococcus planocerae]|uniref:aminoglycoside phosphotransferase family protein n=1 Tax=Deinococcus planocerae TaxID=1737569 RepID=UPI000C7EE24F|nr:aminoglycoside phosphotransferase family protein [Deinococcus planocerae]
MSAEPALDRAALLRVLGSEYGLEVESLTFLPEGTAPAYRAEGSGGRFFVKVMPGTAHGAELRKRVAAELPLLRALRGLGLLTRVPQPLFTRDGADFAGVEDCFLALFAWIEGTNLESGWTGALGELAPLLSHLHAGTEEIVTLVPQLPVPPEDFGLPFERGLSDDLRLLKTVRQDDRPGVRALRDLLPPYEATIERLLKSARGFQAAARARPHRYVVCHTDAHGGNVMRDMSGDLWIIDWETARLAPPEHDLWMLHERLPEVLPAYEAVAGRSANLDPNLLGFYLCRRALEDVARAVNLILHQNTRPEQDQDCLTGLDRDILPSVAGAEGALEALLGRLDAG